MEEQNNVQEPTKKKSGTVKLVLIVALIAALAGAAGMYFFMESREEEKTEKAVDTANEVITNNQTVNDMNNTTENGGAFLNGIFGNNENTTVDTNTTVEQNVIVDNNTTIDNNATIDNNTVIDNNTTVDTNTTVDNNTQQPSTNVNVKESSVEKPLAFGEWGNASKYVSEYLSKEYKDVKYTGVPVSVTKVTRGKDAAEMVKKWCDKSSFYKYEDAKTNMEWAVVDYKVDLTVLKFDEGTIGTDYDISAGVKGINGGSIEYNNMRYYVTTTDMTSSDYVKQPGVYEGQFAVQLPVGCTDYIITMGNETNGAISYFKGQ